MGAQKRDRNQMDGGNNENSDCAPPPKKQRKENPKPPKNCKYNKKGNFRTFFQLSDFTEKQIKNILQNTKKNINRPLILFADNNWDNYWLQRARYIQENNTKTGYRHKRQLDDELDIDINSKLLSKYDDLESDNFLSFGIVTYYQNQSSLKNWKNFKSNVNANFLPLKNLIKKNNIKEIVIPSKYPYTKKPAVGIISHKFNGPGLKIKHLRYIQSKIDQLVKEYINTDYPVLYGDGCNFLLYTENQQNLQKHHIYPETCTVSHAEIKNDAHQHDEMDEKLPDLPLENNFNTNDHYHEEERIIPSLRPEIGTTVTSSTQSFDSNDSDNCQPISSRILMERVREQQIIINDQRIELDFAYQRRGYKINNNNNKWIILFLGLIAVFLSFVANNYVIAYFCVAIICVTLCLRFKMDTLSLLYIFLFGLILFFGWILFPALATSVSHIISTDIDDDAYYVNNTFVLYLYGIILWGLVVAILSRIMSINFAGYAYFIAMLVGGPFMYFIASEIIVSVFYGHGINAPLSNEQRLETLWSFICAVLFPFVCVAVFIGFVIQWASTSPQLEHIINWTSFGKLVLCIIGLYAMMYHLRLTFYVIAIFSFFYIIIQCLTVSGIDIANYPQTTTREIQTAPDLY